MTKLQEAAKVAAGACACEALIDASLSLTHAEPKIWGFKLTQRRTAAFAACSALAAGAFAWYGFHDNGDHKPQETAMAPLRRTNLGEA